jgi:hypothetical protein
MRTQFQPSRFSVSEGRRNFLQVGTLGALGLTLSQMLRMEAQAASGSDVSGLRGQAKSVIHVYLSGGIAHQESWDPKPLASADYRGPFAAIDTAIPGVKIGERFKNVAKILNKATIIRSMTHGEAAHERGTHNMWTGYRPSPAIKYPSFGSVVSHELGVRNNLPPYVAVPNAPNEFAGSGYLSSAYSPFGLGSDPAQNDFKVRDLSLPEGIDERRFDRRKSLLSAVDDHFRSVEESDALDANDAFYQRAYNMISSQEAREAFDLNKEDNKVRDAYGRNQVGARLLLARRLVESGVRFVSVDYGGWDHHGNIKGGFDRLAPNLDQGLAHLITDLEERGLLDSTLIMVTSEFGRTPKINAGNGRDHWPRVFSSFLAGGGISRGNVYGSSDSLGGEPESDAVSPENLAFTVYHQLGIDAHKRLMSPGDRPIDIIRGGSLIEGILG